LKSPEVESAVESAIGSLQQAQANLNLAQITADRWKEMFSKNTVSHQDADQKQGDLEAAKASAVAAFSQCREAAAT